MHIYFIVPVNNNEKNTQVQEADKEILININCPLQLILNYIRSIIGLDDTSKQNTCQSFSLFIFSIAIITHL